MPMAIIISTNVTPWSLKYSKSIENTCKLTTLISEIDEVLVGSEPSKQLSSKGLVVFK